MKGFCFALLLVNLFAACHQKFLPGNSSKIHQSNSGTYFFEQVNGRDWKFREELAKSWFAEGYFPAFLSTFKKVSWEYTDSTNGKKYKAAIWVMPDYLSIGNNQDWVRMPLTPMTAQFLADKWKLILPNRKMVDLIYENAAVQLTPVPMYAFRDSSVTLWQHHLMIEGQRKGRKGLIAGIKKDVVFSNKVLEDKRPNRVAIYGWHQLNGKPIQPLYTGHVNWYVDYSHGIRLIYPIMKINGKKIQIEDVLKDPVLSKVICDEANCSLMRYPI
ncbi:MAG: hypothetical protein MH132_09690 [Hydrotalea sp.]|nr:hypothetical protein [Hydrotalea sp.]